VIAAWQQAKKAVPGLKLVIAPRHTERLAETENSLRSAGVKFFKLSEAPVDGADCMVVDCSGLLQAFYSISQVCFVGGTLDNTGGHNLLEPSLFARPVLFGPNFRNARTAGERLIEKHGGFLTETAAQMAERLVELLTDPPGLEAAGKNSAAALASLKGATAKTLAALTSPR
jgi:3-deoxy-D-manno-octulosonic-acid transferase